MNKNRVRVFSLGSLAMLFGAVSGLSACGSSSGSGSSSGGKGKVALQVKSASAATFLLTDGTPSSIALNPSPGILTAGDYGAASVGVGGLTSLKLYIYSIQLCRDMTISGSGYSGTVGCTTVYTNPLANDDYSTYTPALAATATAGKYVDLLSATDRANMTSSTTVDAGTYNYGIISWYPPIKITGSVSLYNSHSISTKTCSNASVPCSVTGVSDTTASETIYDSHNGGTWFKFLTPFVVTENTDVTVDLAFDLEKKLFAGDGVSNGFEAQTSGCSIVAGGYCGLYIPGIRLSPVPRLATESTKIETYEMASPGGQWKMRVDLYYNSADPTQSVLAADASPIPTSTTASSIAAGIYISTVSTSGNTTNFLDFNGNTQFSFVRGTTGSATMLCPSGATLPGCTAGSNVTLTWTSRTVQTLQN